MHETALAQYWDKVQREREIRAALHEKHERIGRMVCEQAALLHDVCTKSEAYDALHVILKEAAS